MVIIYNITVVTIIMATARNETRSDPKDHVFYTIPLCFPSKYTAEANSSYVAYHSFKSPLQTIIGTQNPSLIIQTRLKLNFEW